MPPSQYVRYSEAFKLKVVREFESGHFKTVRAAQCAYDIKGNNTVGKWVQKYGRAHLLNKRIRVETRDEISELDRIRTRNRQLEALVADMSMEHALGKAAFDLLCEQQGVDGEVFKKKGAVSKSNGRGK